MPKVKMTERWYERLPAPKVRTNYFDSGFTVQGRSLVLRVTPAGTGTWYRLHREHGKLVWFKLDPQPETVRDARAAAADTPLDAVNPVGT